MPRRGQIQWDYEQRVCLHLLWSHEQNLSLSERTRVYNHIFKNHLEACGVPAGGADSGKLRLQYAELRKVNNPTWEKTWASVRQPPDTDEDRALRAKLRAQIDDVLRNNERVDIAGDTRTPPETPRRTPRERKATQNPYESYTGTDPITPVQQQRGSTRTHSTSNPYVTPAASTRKRPASTQTHILAEHDEDEFTHGEAEHVLRTRVVKASSPTVEVPPFREDIVYQTPRTVNRTPKRRKATYEGEKMELMRASGKVVMLRPELHALASLPMRPVSEADAHPSPPALLFRYWHQKSHGINNDRGFTAGKFIPQRILVEPPGPPSCDNIDMNYFANHLNNTGTDQGGIPSPL